MRGMLGTGHAMAAQNNVDSVYYNTFFAGGVACGGAQTPEPIPWGTAAPPPASSARPHAGPVCVRTRGRWERAWPCEQRAISPPGAIRGGRGDQQYYKQAEIRTSTLHTFFIFVWGAGQGVKNNLTPNDTAINYDFSRPDE